MSVLLYHLHRLLADWLRPEAPAQAPQFSSRDWADLPVYHPQCDTAPF
ncbi:hypothetical protein [Devosia aquimaris]|nr:hypothetical protein [Devosia sp. CJK-A8-3]